jgi:hypothetical protein
VIWLHFLATNNVVEYEALINGLHIAIELRVQWLYIYGDSKLVLNQVMGESNCHDSHMAAYRQEVRMLEEKYGRFELHHIFRHDNEAADALSRMGSSHEQPPSSVFVQDPIKSSIRLNEDDPTPVPGIRPEGGSLALTLNSDPGALYEPTGLAW